MTVIEVRRDDVLRLLSLMAYRALEEVPRVIKGRRTYYRTDCDLCREGWIRTKTSVRLCDCAQVRLVLEDPES